MSKRQFFAIIIAISIGVPLVNVAGPIVVNNLSGLVRWNMSLRLDSSAVTWSVDTVDWKKQMDSDLIVKKLTRIIDETLEHPAGWQQAGLDFQFTEDTKDAKIVFRSKDNEGWNQCVVEAGGCARYESQQRSIVYLNPYDLSLENPEWVIKIINHEVGHILGLGHRGGERGVMTTSGSQPYPAWEELVAVNTRLPANLRGAIAPFPDCGIFSLFSSSATRNSSLEAWDAWGADANEKLAPFRISSVRQLAVGRYYFHVNLHPVRRNPFGCDVVQITKIQRSSIEVRVISSNEGGAFRDFVGSGSDFQISLRGHGVHTLQLRRTREGERAYNNDIDIFVDATKVMTNLQAFF